MRYQRSKWKDGIPPKTVIIATERYVRKMRKLRTLRLRNSHFRPGYRTAGKPANRRHFLKRVAISF
jgi:hypothetical protein